MQLIVVKDTDRSVDCNLSNIEEQLDQILEDQDIIECKKFNNINEMVEIIGSYFEENSDVVVYGLNDIDEHNNVIIGYFLDTLVQDESKVKNIKCNQFASQIITQTECVTGPFIIVKMSMDKERPEEIEENNFSKLFNGFPQDLHLCELRDIILNIYIKVGIVLETDGSMSTYTYTHCPIEPIMKIDQEYEKHYKYDEYEIYNSVLIMIVKLDESEQDLINKNASYLANKIIKNRVFIGLYKKPFYNESAQYKSLSIETMEKICHLRAIYKGNTPQPMDDIASFISLTKIIDREYELCKNKKRLEIECFQEM